MKDHYPPRGLCVELAQCNRSQSDLRLQAAEGGLDLGQHQAHPAAAPGLRPARGRTESDRSHDRDRLKAAGEQKKPNQYNGLRKNYGLNRW